ncbi:MAG: hypothetical protein A2V66_08845 [Ignavibacteria bacterium RBG_13_36_8]|nr:MAG: hypothetical protein A2V66_08845 [Ignavibacteria bacterium RBG_13_36_8]
MKLRKIILVIPIIVISSMAMVLFQSCGSDKEESSKSMQQIQSEEGIPVVVELIQYKLFSKYLSFFSKLSGIKEAIEGAAVGGRIEKINVKVGDYVKKGQVVMEFPYDATALQYEQAKSAFENAEKNYERMKVLLKSGEISQANFDGVETQYLVAKRNYETQKQMMFVEAPFDGMITSIAVNEGDNVKGKDPLFTVTQLSQMRTRIWASEDEIRQIRNGMSAFVEYQGKKYRGSVVEKSIVMDPYRQAYYAEIEFNNPGNELKSGPTVDVKILVYENPNAIIIPRNLVKQDENGYYVFVENRGTAEKKYITNGKESGINYEVSSGLNIGDRLIVKGSAQLVNGTKVKVTQ